MGCGGIYFGHPFDKSIPNKKGQRIMPNETVFKRYDGNPIITARAVSGANSIFNSAVVKFQKGYAGIFRVDGHNLSASLHQGFSKDGITWKIGPHPVKMTTKYDINPTSGGYDPRVVKIGEKFYITWCTGDNGASIGLAETSDFKSFRKLEHPLPPFNRNGVLFPRKVGGKYLLLHRPSDNGHTPFGKIFLSASPDLEYWGHHRHVLSEFGGWGYTKIGPGPAPLEISDGWLCLIHGVRQTCSGFVYVIGGMILDKNEPWKVKHLCRNYLLAPSEYYERVGDVPNVVFPTSLFVDDDKRLRLYYGCADTCVALAYSTVKEVVEFIKDYPVYR
jgi:beta-1,4-mannooligosaccharide/beta-1,4-mannosyl-N-acetylglucosamine phosphorylase